MKKKNRINKILKSKQKLMTSIIFQTQMNLNFKELSNMILQDVSMFMISNILIRGVILLILNLGKETFLITKISDLIKVYLHIFELIFYINFYFNS